MPELVAVLTEPPHPSEYAWSLSETTAKIDGENHRVQIVKVARNDNLCSYTHDLGLAQDHPYPAFVMPLMFEHTLDEAYDLATKYREEGGAVRLREAATERSTFVEDVIRQFDEDARILKNQSTFGPGGNIQRNGYSRSAARLRKESL